MSVLQVLYVLEFIYSYISLIKGKSSLAPPPQSEIIGFRCGSLPVLQWRRSFHLLRPSLCSPFSQGVSFLPERENSSGIWDEERRPNGFTSFQTSAIQLDGVCVSLNPKEAKNISVLLCFHLFMVSDRFPLLPLVLTHLLPIRQFTGVRRRK